MKVIEFKKTLKEQGSSTLWKQHMRNEIYLTDKQLDKILKLK